MAKTVTDYLVDVREQNGWVLLSDFLRGRAFPKRFKHTVQRYTSIAHADDTVGARHERYSLGRDHFRQEFSLTLIRAKRQHS